MQTLSEEILEIIDNHRDASSATYEELNRNPYKITKTIAYHALDRHVSGERDPHTGGVKPFYNISRYRVNVAVRATDFSTRDMNVEADDPNYYARAMVLQKYADRWMKETGFAATLNKFGWIRAEYGTALLKKTEMDGKLYLDVPYWHNLIVDPYDIDGTKIEIHHMNPVQLNAKRDVWDNVDEAIDCIHKEIKSSSSRKKATSMDTVEVYEIEGIFPKYYVDETADENEYCLQHHFVTGPKLDIVLFSEEIKETRYKALHWKAVPGSALGRGIVEDSFEAQAWTNIAKMQEAQMMDYGSKIVLRSADRDIAGNILTEVLNGQIITSNDLQQVDLTPRTINQLETLFRSWDEQVEKTTHTFNAITGEDMPSGTPLGAVQIQNANSESYFAYRREEAGIFWTEVWQDWIMPFLIKKLESEGAVTAEFTQAELANILDEVIIRKNTLDRQIASILNDEPEDPAEIQEEIQKKLKAMVNRRTIKFAKGTFKDAKMRTTWVTTNEQNNKRAVLQNLSSILQAITQNPQLLENGPANEIFSKMIEISGLGISPASLGFGAVQQPRTDVEVPQAIDQRQIAVQS